MDPNVAYGNAVRAMAEVQEALIGNGDLPKAAEALADAFGALDGWIAAGGFLPEAWNAAR